MDVVLDGDVAELFASGKKKLKPVIFSHGLVCMGVSYSGILKDLASHGYIVFALNHQDGSGLYTEKRDGTPVVWTR